MKVNPLGDSMLRKFIKLVVPKELIFLRRERDHRLQSADPDERQASEIFGDIYRRNVWGGEPGQLYSGSGSDDEISSHYVTFVSNYISANKIRSVVDLGCGDFRVGRQIISPEIDFVGVDVVQDIVDRNTAEFGSDKVKFVGLDVINEPLPPGELYLVRQVLQHLSNEQIRFVLDKLDHASHVIIAEHHPSPHRFKTPNVQKAPGRGTRIGYRSGVFPDKAPFSKCYRIAATTPVRPIVAPDECISIYVKAAD